MEIDPKDFLVKIENDPLTSRLNSSFNLSILSHLENHNYDTDLVNFKSTIIDTHRRILTVNLLDKNEQKSDAGSVSSSNAGRPNKMVHFMLEFDNSSNGQLSAKTNKSLPQIQPFLNYYSSPLASKNFPGNKLTSVPFGRSLSNCRSTMAKRTFSKDKWCNNSEYVEKWNDDEYNLVNSEQNDNQANAAQEEKDSDEEPENSEMKVVIEPLQQETCLHNSSMNSIELLSKLSRIDPVQSEDPYLNNDCNKTKSDSKIDVNLEKTKLISCHNSSRGGSPSFLKGPTTSTITIVQPAVSNLSLESIPNKLNVNNYCHPGYQNYSNNQNIRQKKIIKLQDCSNWLNLPQKAYSNLSSNLTKRSCSAYITRNEYDDKNGQNFFPNSNYNRIQMLLNRKSNRVNT